MLSPLIVSVCVNNGFKIMIVFMTLAVVCFVCGCLLKESFGVAPAEVVEELKESINARKLNVLKEETDSLISN